jgi:putative flippase GtrA
MVDDDEQGTALRRLLHWSHARLSTNTGVRYLATGAALFFLDLAIYVVLHMGFGIAIMTAQLISRTTGAAVGFIAHKFISFAAGDQPQASSVARQSIAYTIVMGANIIISPFLVVWLVGLLDGRAVAGKLVSDAIIITETYLILRVIFRAEARP